MDAFLWLNEIAPVNNEYITSEKVAHFTFLHFCSLFSISIILTHAISNSHLYYLTRQKRKSKDLHSKMISENLNVQYISSPKANKSRNTQ